MHQLTPADYHETLLALFYHGSFIPAANSLNLSHHTTRQRIGKMEAITGRFLYRRARSHAPIILNELGRQFIYETVIADDGLKPGPALIARLQGNNHESNH